MVDTLASQAEHVRRPLLHSDYGLDVSEGTPRPYMGGGIAMMLEVHS